KPGRLVPKGSDRFVSMKPGHVVVVSGKGEFIATKIPGLLAPKAPGQAGVKKRGQVAVKGLGQFVATKSGRLVVNGVDEANLVNRYPKIAFAKAPGKPKYLTRNQITTMVRLMKVE